jgi:hypothetical protein
VKSGLPSSHFRPVIITVPRPPKLVLGSGRGFRDAQHPHKLALNAKQLGSRPEFFIFDHREPEPPRLTQSLRHLRRDETGRGVGFDEFAQAGAKQLQPGVISPRWMTS